MSTFDVRHIVHAAVVGSSLPAEGSAGIGRPPRWTARRIWLQTLCVLGVAPVEHAVDAVEPPFSIGWPLAFAVNTGVGLLLAAFAANASRSGYEGARVPFYLSIVLFFFPAAIRLSLPGVSRAERFTNAMIVTFGLFMLRVIRAPQFLLGHDEYLHWVTAQNIVEHHHLFSPNVVFPIGPLFPGLEIAVTALSELSGLSVFVSAALVLAAARLLFVGALLLFYERVTGSARIAAMGTMFYAGCSTFIFFDTNFAYESLAQPLLMLALLLATRMTADSCTAPIERPLPQFAAFSIVLLALSVTHHVTAFAFAALMLALVVLEAARIGPKAVNERLWPAALLAVLIPVSGSWAMGNPGTAYLGPVFENGLREVSQMLHFGSTGRKLFTADDGTVAPLWERTTTLSAVAIVCAGLALGFFRSLSVAGLPLARGVLPITWRSVLNWKNSGLVLLTLLTIAYPLAIMFRLTRSGWEIGNRMGPYAFLGVGVVLAIVVSTLMQRDTRHWLRASAIGLSATIVLIGGIISSEGPRILVPARYKVSADAASIEPMGVEAAAWTKDWLGPGRRFAADRVNRLLLSGYGRQLVSTTLQHGYDAGVILAASELGQNEIDLISKLGLDYLFVDLRLTTGLPVVGAYFDGAAADRMLSAPPTAKALLKFNSVSNVSRVFDNGYEIIYDVRALSGRR
jgi:hypothetical protein